MGGGLAYSEVCLVTLRAFDPTTSVELFNVWMGFLWLALYGAMLVDKHILYVGWGPAVCSMVSCLLLTCMAGAMWTNATYYVRWVFMGWNIGAVIIVAWLAKYDMLYKYSRHGVDASVVSYKHKGNNPSGALLGTT